MRLIKFKRVICVNNEIQAHGAKNLLLTEIDPKKKWLSEKGVPKGIVLLELECATVITAVRIGNAHSAFVEVLVGNLGEPTDKYQTLIPPSMFMNMYDSKDGTNTDQVRVFYQKDFRPNTANKKWHCVQIVCTQPFNDQVPFGLCFVNVTGLGDDLEIVAEEKDVPSKKSTESARIGGKTPTGSEKIKKSEEKITKMKVAPVETETMPGPSKTKKEKVDHASDDRKNKQARMEGSLSQERSVSRESPGGKKMKKHKGQQRPLSRLMEDVHFTISGIQNPERRDLRTKAAKMGATYYNDWNNRCTHLVCVFINTPKYKRAKGKGKIVTKDWIEACYTDLKRYPWRRYALDASERKIRESEEEIIAEDDDTSDGEKNEAETQRTSLETAGTKPVHKKQALDDPCVTDTDDEESRKPDTTNYPMPYLPDFFSGKTFYVDGNLRDCSRIERYIVAYSGNLKESLDEEVEFYITKSGGEVLQILRKKAPKMIAVRPYWIWEMNSESAWISPWKFMCEM